MISVTLTKNHIFVKLQYQHKSQKLGPTLGHFDRASGEFSRNYCLDNHIFHTYEVSFHIWMALHAEVTA